MLPLKINKKISIKKIILLSITTIIIFFILFKTVKQETNINTILSQVNINYFVLSIGVGLLSFLLGSGRWFFLIKLTDYQIKFSKVFSLVSSSFALNIIPGRFGDFARIYPIRNQMPMITSANSIILEKIIDVFSLLFIASIGLFLNKRYLWFIGTLCLTMGIIIAIFIIFKFYKKLKKSFKMIDDFYEILFKMRIHKRYFFYSFIMSLINWFVSILMVFILFISFSKNVDLPIIMAYMPFSIFAGLIPISLAGLGTRESVLVLLLTQQNIPNSITLLVGLSYSFISYFIFSLIGFPFFIKEFKTTQY